MTQRLSENVYIIAVQYNMFTAEEFGQGLHWWIFFGKYSQEGCKEVICHDKIEWQNAYCEVANGSKGV